MSDRARDPYKVLQVDPEADPEVIQAAYRRLAQKHHPDLSAAAGSPDRMAEINAAWEVLGDPARRARYDRERAAEQPREPSRADPSPARSTAAAASVPLQSPRSADRVTDVSPDWTSGRSSVGSGYDASMRRPDGAGAAGPPPGNASGAVLTFGRYSGWSLGEIARSDADYLEWLDRMPIGRPYRDEIDAILRRAGRRRSAARPDEARGLFPRR